MTVSAPENFNIGYHCSTRQCELGYGEQVAMRWIPAAGEREDYTFAWLARESDRFARMLAQLGVHAGDVLFTFLPKSPEQFVVCLGGLKRECVVGTLFANFGPDALLDRLGDAGAVLLVTTRTHLLKLKPVLASLPALRHILLVDGDDDPQNRTLSYPRLMAETPADYPLPLTAAETPSLLHYTSGSTGKPKGVLHCHRSLLHQSATTAEVLGLTGADRFWCTADQGWVTGTSYGMIGPWALGVTQIHYGGGFDPARWMEVLEDEMVTVWYTAPTALRMLSRADDALYAGRNLAKLRSIFSVGEPLNPEVFFWGERVLQRTIHDTWFQTETGGILIANRPGERVLPGSMGRPVDGIRAAILDAEFKPLSAGAIGQLCIATPWSSLFATYLHAPQRYRQKFHEGWYLTGDLARCDDEGRFWFVGRDDDVINTAGHLVSPFEVESCLLELPEIVEAGVIAAPDELVFEKVVAFVHLRPNVTLDEALTLRIKAFVGRRLSSLAIPQEILAIPAIPKNKSGKIMRRYLKSLYLGEAPGDLSTLETV